MVHLLNKIFEETIRPEVRFLLLLSMLLCLENIFNVIFKMFKQYKSGKNEKQTSLLFSMPQK